MELILILNIDEVGQLFGNQFRLFLTWWGFVVLRFTVLVKVWLPSETAQYEKERKYEHIDGIGEEGALGPKVSLFKHRRETEHSEWWQVLRHCQVNITFWIFNMIKPRRDSEFEYSDDTVKENIYVFEVLHNSRN